MKMYISYEDNFIFNNSKLEKIIQCACDFLGDKKLSNCKLFSSRNYFENYHHIEIDLNYWVE